MSAEHRTSTDDTIDKLRRRIKPAAIVAELADGSSEKIDLLDRRGRWERVKRFLESSDWTALRCYSDKECTERLDTVPNPELAAAEEPEDDAPEGVLDSPLDQARRMFQTAAEHVDRMMGHLRGGSKDLEDSRAVFVQTITAQYAELANAYSRTHAELQSAMEMIAALRAERGEDMTPKEQAMLGFMDVAGQKFLGLPPMGLLRGLPRGPSNGTGQPATEGGGGL